MPLSHPIFTPTLRTGERWLTDCRRRSHHGSLADALSALALMPPPED
jgi:hypothetical protein